MKAEEYQDLIDDPTAYFLNVYFPRIFGSLKPLTAFPLLPPVNEIPMVPPLAMPFGSEDMKKALKCLAEAGEEALRWRAAIREIGGRIMGKGFPSFSGGLPRHLLMSSGTASGEPRASCWTCSAFPMN